MIFPIIVLALVFLLIAIRQIGNFKLQIWQVMLGGSILVLVTSQISISEAVLSVNFDVILFLFGMFIIGRAMEKSGLLNHLSYRLFRNAENINLLMVFLVFGSGIGAAFLMNDTIAIIGTPVVLLLARQHNINAKILLLALAFSITIGSVMSPIGNPQNLLIAINGNITNSFIVFFKYLFFPTIVNLTVVYIILKLFYKKDLANREIIHIKEPLKDEKLSKLVIISLIILIFLIILKTSIVLLRIDFDLRLTYIALISCLPIILFSSKRFKILKTIDWHTIIFFISMFILMESVWNTGLFQLIINKYSADITSINMIMSVSILLSQLISNVPLVALYLPMLQHAGVGTKELIALAVGSTIAGNVLILGAASNIIIIQNAEKKEKKNITFWEFAKIGIPLTIINSLLYYVYLLIV
ncbi:MAG: SLC13 family permease [Candidatus Woesearchaeota archaeon]